MQRLLITLSFYRNRGRGRQEKDNSELGSIGSAGCKGEGGCEEGDDAKL